MQRFIIAIPLTVLNGEGDAVLSDEEMQVDVYAEDPHQAIVKLEQKLDIGPPVKRPPATPPKPLRPTQARTK